MQSTIPLGGYCATRGRHTLRPEENTCNRRHHQTHGVQSSPMSSSCWPICAVHITSDRNSDAFVSLPSCGISHGQQNGSRKESSRLPATRTLLFVGDQVINSFQTTTAQQKDYSAQKFIIKFTLITDFQRKQLNSAELRASFKVRT
jgi:hypothetical protein